MDLSKFLVRFARDTSHNTLEGVRGMLVNSLAWSAEQLGGMSAVPLIEQTGLARTLRNSSEQLRTASGKTDEALTGALVATGDAMARALEALDVTDSVVHRSLFENIQVASIVGESFAGIELSKITPSFRLKGQDVSAADVVADQKASGLKRTVLCVPGLFCDETLWESTGEPPLADIMRGLGYYPLFVRFNPGAHISTNGAALLRLMGDYLKLYTPKAGGLRALTYSQGGLILRSALYQDRQEANLLGPQVHSAVFVNSPDGGSYIEKLGFWLGLGLELFPIAPVRLLGFIGNQRSDAMKDLSHGIIREEDWTNADHVGRYKSELYFGELEGIELYQVYSLVSKQVDPWASWIGDGIVEKPSLTYLSDRVFRKQSRPETRVTCLYEKSHFQVLAAPETAEVMRRALKK